MVGGIKADKRLRSTISEWSFHAHQSSLFSLINGFRNVSPPPDINRFQIHVIRRLFIGTSPQTALDFMVCENVAH
jgi:hypothetical protein